MIDLSEFEEKKEVSFWSRGKAAHQDDFAEGEKILVKSSDGTKKRCVYSQKLISFLEKKLASGEVHWASVTRL